ncbi:MAG: VCBS repeat-containing protein [Phycisphaerales bacterium]|jgi:hypothetical protein|nr:VCBS repeat-containing protein [Phycisphaerales bacterium]
MLTPTTVAIALLHFAGAVDETPLGDFFGFSSIESIKIGDHAGPMYQGDVNGDGLQDLLVVNNHKSRIDLLVQKRNASPDDAIEITRANDIPEHWRFKKSPVMVSHKVSALTLFDFNGDDLTDIVYASNPSNIVFLAQKSDGTFEKERQHRIRKMHANRSGFKITDVIGDAQPDLITLIDGNIQIFPVDGDALGKPVVLTTEDRIGWIILADYDGNGLDDIAGIASDSSEPVRLWLAQQDGSDVRMGPQLRFELPALREFAAVKLPNKEAALMAMIERTSKRIVLSELGIEPIENHGDRDTSIEIFPFLGKEKRSQTTVDVNGDGLQDVIATNTDDNTIVVYPQTPTKGLAAGVPSPTLSGVDALAVCDLDEDGIEDLFVLSEDEGVVGRSPLSVREIPFPQPMPISAGFTPVTLDTVKLGEIWNVAIVTKKKREYALELINADGNSEIVELGSLSRGPNEIVAFDADQDDQVDLLLLTRDKPMMMLHATETGFELLEDTDMGQFGLVREASADNTAIFDIDGDAQPELLIADENFVRAVRYEPETATNISAGWQVVQQINLQDGESDLVSLAITDEAIIVADKANDRLVLIDKSDGARWAEGDSLFVRGFDFGPIYAGDFTSDGINDMLAIGDAGFAVVQLAGERITLNEVQSWRSEHERVVEHELAVGDTNNDGFVDMVALDAGEQMLEIFTFTDQDNMLFATEFKIFETRIFSSGEPSEYEPSQVFIADLTGDTLRDIVLLSHDRVLIYPQEAAGLLVQ